MAMYKHFKMAENAANDCDLLLHKYHTYNGIQYLVTKASLLEDSPEFTFKSFDEVCAWIHGYAACHNNDFDNL